MLPTQGRFVSMVSFTCCITRKIINKGLRFEVLILSGMSYHISSSSLFTKSYYLIDISFWAKGYFTYLLTYIN